MTTEEFIATHRDADVNTLALRVRQYPEVDAAFALQQIEGWQKARTKLPTLAEVDDWWWPKRLSMEQCSSERTALYKRQILSERKDLHYLTDLTGGFGIDFFYLSSLFERATYVERQQELCEIARHNFGLLGREHLSICHTSAEDHLSRPSLYKREEHVLFLDPARRDAHGGKVFRLQDCEPNVVELFPTLARHASQVMLKLSPMLDISEAVRALTEAGAQVEEVHVVAVRNEVKEVLVVARANISEATGCRPANVAWATACSLVCVNLESSDEPFRFTQNEEAEAEVTYVPKTPLESFYLYEPNSAIMKAGAYKLLSKRFGLQKLAPNTHLYCSTREITDFPGRIFHAHAADKQELKQLGQANIICRNYPLKPEELKRKFKLRDGGENYVIGARINEKAELFLANRLR